MLRVTPIYGATGHHPLSTSLSIPPSCTLIEYGGVKVLVNVGWDESYTLPNASTNTLNESNTSETLHRNIPPLELPQVDAVLLTDSSLQALGGVPIYFGPRSTLHARTGKTPSGKISICTTYPTLKMGQMTLYDHHANTCLDGQDPGFTLEDVDLLFSPMSPQCIQTLKYSQTLTILDPRTGRPALEVTPHRAGHLVGAAYYILKRVTDDTEVVVAPVYHHAKEKHLDSCTLYKYATACDVLITCPGGPGGLLGALYNPIATQLLQPTSEGDIPKNTKHALATVKKPILNSPSVGRDEGELVEAVLSTLRRGGNVLIPVDASGRVLELLLLLDQHWEKHRLANAYNLAWIGPMATNTIEFARSQLEWMASTIGAQFDSQRGHAFALRNIQIYDSARQFVDATGIGGSGTSGGGISSGSNMGSGGTGTNLSAANTNSSVVSPSISSAPDKKGAPDSKETNPTCVLASGASLDYGPARDLFLKWCENSDNTIILTDSRRCVPRGKIKVMCHLKKNLQNVVQSGSPTNVMRRTVSDTNATDDNTMLGSEIGSSLSHPNVISDESKVTTIIGTGSTADSTSAIADHSTAAQLLLKWCEAKATQEEMADVIEVDIPVRSRAELSGTELESFLAEEEAAKLRQKQEDEKRAILREVELAKGRLRLNEDDLLASDGAAANTRQDASASGSSSNISTITTAPKDLSGRPRKKTRVDPNLFFKYSRPCHLTFEVREEAVGISQSDSVAKYGIGESIARAGEILEDDYGIAINPEHFTDIVTGIDPSKLGGSGKIGEKVRGLGFGTDGRPLLASKDGIMGKKGGGGNVGDRGDDVDEGEEWDLEAQDLSEGKGIIRGRRGRPPVKVFTSFKRLEVLAEILFIPLEGRVDAKAARQSVRALQPRQVIILGGGKPHESSDLNNLIYSRNGMEKYTGEAALLADVVRSFARSSNSAVVIPNDGEVSELCVGHAAYPVRLIDNPYLTKEEKEKLLPSMEEIPSIEPFEVKVGDCSVSLISYVATGQRVAADGSIVLAPRPTPPERKSNPTVMISYGDVLLTDLRSEVIAQGMKAEYSAHEGYFQIIVNGRIIVRKNKASGKINVEGPLCEDFYTVRSIVCNQYVTL